MRGPGLKKKYDLRRLWRCPNCGYERRAHQNQTSLRCHCEKDGPFMKLIEEQRQVRPAAEELDLYVDAYEVEDVEQPPVKQSEQEITGEVTSENENETVTPDAVKDDPPKEE